MDLNTKEITRCTMRIYDPEFAKQLSDLFKKTGGSQNDFFNRLLKEGYKSIAPMYEHMDVPVFASIKKTEKEGEEELLKEIRELLLEKSDVELKDISDLADDHERILKFMACIYNMLSLFGIDEDSIKEIVESGGLDRVPKRFQKMRDYK